MNLLAKTRQLNRMLQKAAGQSVNFMEMAEVLRDTVSANVYVVSRKGKILGYSIANPIKNERLRQMIYDDRRFSNELNQLMLNITETTSNTDFKEREFELEDEETLKGFFNDKLLTIVPIIGGGDRLGTLILVRVSDPFVDDDLILSEYGSTIIGMEILRERAEEIELEARSRAAVQVAMASLSYSELEAVEHIFEELDGSEGLLVASKIADRVGITRSVIVNALRKLESAGVVESRSLGMKGTFIKILNTQILDELRKSKS